MSETENEKFHLGICMAGAVTAGSYTAGVMDYLLETLERWQRQKDANNQAKENGKEFPFPDTPMYDVVIDVISGASAGGMCAAITSAMLAEGYTLDDLANKRSKMYKAWIELDDNEQGEGTIEKMFETDDIGDEGIVSLLNSKVIENISAKTIKKVSALKLPAYVDEKLDIILSLSNLRGARYSIQFISYNNKPKNYLMSQHRDFMHFRMNETPNNQSAFLKVDFNDAADIDLLRQSAVATGAFPVGLSPRGLKRKSSYFYNKADEIAGVSDLNLDERKLIIKALRNPEQAIYESVNVDGGAFNNEPFGEAEKQLNKKSGNVGKELTAYNETNRAILMIDPFPSIEGKEDTDDMKTDILHVGPRIIGALRAQSSFKKEDLLDALSDNNYLKYLIVPSKSDADEPLCCASLEAFGGFLFKGFREHDYELGRRNAQQFLRKHFAMPYDSENEANNNLIHRGWTKNAINVHQEIDQVSETEQVTYLPIIPDVTKVPGSEGINKPFVRKYPLQKLKSLEAPIEKRVEAIVDAAISMMDKKDKKPGQNEPTDILLNYFKKSRASRFFGSVGSIFTKGISWIIVPVAKKKARKALKKAAIKWIIVDLNKAELLTDEENAKQAVT